ncbi:Crp/Fnr family transcriptional regulator [Alteriqipengyuania lutimaris]|uniref:Crp/Fnr family transcriptional regulator n=1 Tax=Alteriqipengyuania lutimaris TaxID=1538146 RepID=A0A395LRA6_9SPHN|nr:Crp/Fnr family transcriptional regulator [Alteriqipengyuania lutimaris]MBB3033851.1 CRP/FNR family transcriptional regulator [Alteriqipengyuania lutimaris]RDS77180.1 Crp/Fnr family transcriptional regulator [Alteriqipengyuania lutimaris]
MDQPFLNRGTNFCDACTVRNRAICGDLDNEEIVALNAIGQRRQLAAGENLLWEGEEAVVVANVVEGLLKLSTSTAEGKEQILGLAFPADFIGRPFGHSTPYSVEALTDVLVCVFRRADFDRFARAHPNLEHKLLERTLTELDRTRKWMLLLGRMTAEQRVATFLLDLSSRVPAGEPGGMPVDAFELKLSRGQIADVLGLTIETVSRVFTKLKQAGVLSLPNRREVAIEDREALVRLAS